MLEFTLTGFVFAIVNFLILAALLYKFLHKPLLDVLEKRRAAIEGAQRKAREAQEAAEKLKQDCDARLAGMEEERDELLAAARRDAATARDNLLEAARNEAERELAGLKRDWDRREREAADALQGALVETSLELVRQILQRLTDANVERKLLDALLAELVQLKDSDHSPADLFAADTAVRVVSATPLSDGDRTRVSDTITGLADAPPTINFSEDASLIAGARVEFVAVAVNSDLADTVGAVLSAASAPGPEPVTNQVETITE
ncbi:MAG: hypothetical protein HN742_13450 [Lentisphaerae bacterium]|nr:hypothetical protein [Lentisphaerota bacterium]MBT4820871.1 hypothetical protein [Lentisphaerota bacterium]MBT5608220.1 hypothetical protein [Lentisphaerota bacterium]MBT7058891.1 hypothetical protein [Lentisphaerota bacterium]MBT7842878.1 hypothetical protein [Lentisphaerota bacterium]